MLQCVALLQCVVGNTTTQALEAVLQCAAVCCRKHYVIGVGQYVAVCSVVCRVLPCVALICSVLPCVAVFRSDLHRALQGDAVCCSALSS